MTPAEKMAARKNGTVEVTVHPAPPPAEPRFDPLDPNARILMKQARHAARFASTAALRAEALAEVSDADDVPCAACVALNGIRPCSVECYVKAGYQAENFAAFCADRLTPTERAAKLDAEAAAEAIAKAEAAEKLAVAKALADAEAAKAEEARLKAEADEAAARKAAAEAAELAALEEATKPEPKAEPKSEAKSRR